MDDETMKGAAGDGRPYRALAALLPRLHDRDKSAKSPLIRAIFKEIGPRGYKAPDPEKEWETATRDQCESALVFFWRADYMGGNPIDGGSLLDEAIKSGLVARIVQRLLGVSDDPVPRCPSCQSVDVLPYLYGEPMMGTKGSMMGPPKPEDEVVIGGCIVDPENPLWKCRVCLHDFGRLGDERPEMFEWKEREDG